MNNYYKGLAKYTHSKEMGFFKHNLKNDYQLFIIWQNGRSFENEIIEKVESNFEILSKIDLEWSKDKVVENFNRLYKAFDNPYISNKAETMGNGNLLCLMVKDNDPKYNYRKTVSGTIELVNTKAVKVKRESRALCSGYYVHSSASPEEFYEQAILLLGDAILKEVLNGNKKTLFLSQDLKGANGWKNFSDLFITLRYSSNYLVLRNFEFLPFDFFDNDKDVDILCKDVNDFISASNAKVIDINDGGAKLIVRVEDQDVPFDIRFVGDNYYNSNWAKDMLSQRIQSNNEVYRPRIDDYFFSLLYHSVLQKPKIKPVYIEVFDRVSKELEFDFFDIDKIYDKKYVASLLEGYFYFKGYSYTEPKDEGVYINYSVLKYIAKDLGGKNSKRISRLIKTITPRKVIDKIPLSIKTKVHSIIK
jgi:hypothetical protein